MENSRGAIGHRYEKHRGQGHRQHLNPEKRGCIQGLGKRSEHRLRIHHNDRELICHRRPSGERRHEQVKEQWRCLTALAFHRLKCRYRCGQDLAHCFDECRKRAELLATFPGGLGLQFQICRLLPEAPVELRERVAGGRSVNSLRGFQVSIGSRQARSVARNSPEASPSATSSGENWPRA